METSNYHKSMETGNDQNRGEIELKHYMLLY